MRLVPWAGLTLMILSLALFTSFAPTASAEINFEDVRVDLGPEKIDARLMGHRFEGPDARDLRVLIDRDHGNDDGEVDQDELDAFVEAQKDAYNDQLRFGGSFFFEPFKIRGHPSMTQEVTDMTFSEPVLGDVDSEQTVTQDVDAILTFRSTERSRLEFRFEEDFSVPFSQVDMRWGNATFRTVSGWAIDPDSISPGGEGNPFLADGRFVVPYEQSGEFSSSDEPLVFEIVDTNQEPLDKDSKDSPAPAALLVLGTLLAALATARRSVRR